MLRDIKCPHPYPFLYGFKVVYTGGVPAVTIGVNDVSSVTDNAAGDFTINLKRPFSFAGANSWDSVSVCTPMNSGGNVEAQVASSSKSAIRAGRIAGAGDENCYVLTLGFYNREALNSNTLKHVLMGNMQNGRFLAFRTDGSTGVTLGGSCVSSVTRNGAGDFTVVYKQAFGAEPVVVGTVFGAGQRFTVIPADTNTSQVRFILRQGGGGLVDSPANVFVYGPMARSNEGGLRRPVKTMQRQSILHGCVLDRVTQQTDLNSVDGTYGSGASGVSAYTFAKAFRRATIAVATTAGEATANGTLIEDSSSTAVTLKTLTTAGVLTDSTVSCLILGTNDPGES